MKTNLEKISLYLDNMQKHLNSTQNACNQLAEAVKETKDICKTVETSNLFCDGEITVILNKQSLMRIFLAISPEDDIIEVWLNVLLNSGIKWSKTERKMIYNHYGCLTK